jgi:hypothetical protein
LKPSKYGDVYIKPSSPPTPPDEKTKRLMDLALRGPTGQRMKGWERISMGTRVKKKKEEEK